MSEPSILGYRITSGIFALITLLGWLWFAGTFGVVMSIYTPVIFMVLLTAALASPAAYMTNSRYALAVAYSVGILVSLMAVYVDLTRSPGPDTHAASLRVIEIIILVMLTKIALIKTDEKDA